MFRRINRDERFNTSHLVGYITVSPALLTKTFGYREYGDGYKVSGEFSFEAILSPEAHTSGKLFTIYDWKVTSLYDDEGIDVEEFWESEEPHEFHVGSHDDKLLDEFKAWVLEQVRNAS